MNSRVLPGMEARPALVGRAFSVLEAGGWIRICFVAKPPRRVRRQLEAEGFRWNHTALAWQRWATPGAWDALRRLLRCWRLAFDERNER